MPALSKMAYLEAATPTQEDRSTRTRQSDVEDDRTRWLWKCPTVKCGEFNAVPYNKTVLLQTTSAAPPTAAESECVIC